MTTPPVADEPPVTSDTGPPAPRWELPEIASVVVLASVGVLAIGGTATGLATSIQDPGHIGHRFLFGEAMQLAASWAIVPLAAVLLGVLGVCWWHLGRWESMDNQAPPHDDGVALRHVARDRAMVIWVEAAFGFTAVAAVAHFVGSVLLGISPGPWAWSQDFIVGANMVAVLGMAGTGVVLARRLTHR